MNKWGVNHQQAFIGWHGEGGSNFTAVTNEEEESDNEEEKEQEITIKNEPIFFPDIKKRKRLSLSQLREGKEESSGKLSQLSEVKVESCEKFIQLREVKEEYCGKESGSKKTRKKPEAKDRWSGER
jgi:hypothetical protein